MARDSDYELSVLCGPSPPRDNQITGGVVGELVAESKATKRLAKIVLLAVLGGIGGAGAWIYTAGRSRGDEDATLRQMQKEIKDLQKALYWRLPPKTDSQDP